MNNRAETRIETRREAPVHDGGNSYRPLQNLSNTGIFIDYSRAKQTAVIIFSITYVSFGAITIVIQVVKTLRLL